MNPIYFITALLTTLFAFALATLLAKMYERGTPLIGLIPTLFTSLGLIAALLISKLQFFALVCMAFYIAWLITSVILGFRLLAIDWYRDYIDRKGTMKVARIAR